RDAPARSRSRSTFRVAWRTRSMPAAGRWPSASRAERAPAPPTWPTAGRAFSPDWGAPLRSRGPGRTGLGPRRPERRRSGAPEQIPRDHAGSSELAEATGTQVVSGAWPVSPVAALAKGTAAARAERDPATRPELPAAAGASGRSGRCGPEGRGLRNARHEPERRNEGGTRLR